MFWKMTKKKIIVDECLLLDAYRSIFSSQTRSFFSWHFPCHCYSSRLVVVVVYLAMRQAHITTGFLIIIDRYFYQKRKKKRKENRLFLGTRKYVSIEKNFSSSLHIARTFFVLLNVCIGREQKWPFFVSLSDIFSAYMFFRIIKHLYLFLQQRYKELKKKRKRRRKRERERKLGFPKQHNSLRFDNFVLGLLVSSKKEKERREKIRRRFLHYIQRM